MTPEGLIRISSLLLLILTEGNGQPAIFPGKFTVALRSWIAEDREVVTLMPLWAKMHPDLVCRF